MLADGRKRQIEKINTIGKVSELRKSHYLHQTDLLEFEDLVIKVEKYI